MRKTIKIIDLLNKIANGEEVPKKIKVGNNFYYEYAENIDYRSKEGTYLFDTYIQINKEDMNMKVEIIEEDKEIESIDVEYYKTNDERYNELLEEIASFQEWCIDKVNSLEKEQ